MISYLQRLEIMAFFSGFPLLYLIILSYAGKEELRTATKKRLVSLLPLAYGFIGALYLGLQLRNLYPDYSIRHITSAIQNPFLAGWGLLSIFSFIPAISKKPVICLLHSLVFFYFLLKDLYIQIISTSAEKSILKNDINVYSDSILLNIAAFAIMAILYFLFLSVRKKTKSIS